MTEKGFEIRPGLCYHNMGDDMYNQEIKERFLSEGIGSASHAKVGFLRLEPAEESAGKDIAEMNTEEIRAAFESSGLEDYDMLSSVISAMRRYVEWCSDRQSFPIIARGVFDLTAGKVDLSQTIMRSLFRDDNDLITTIRSVRAFDEGNPEPVVLCLAWLGLRVNEILTLKDPDVNLQSRTVTADGNLVATQFSDQIHDVLEAYVNCKRSERDHRTGPRLVIKDYSTGLFLKRMLPKDSPDFGKPFSASQISTAIGRLNKQLGEDGRPQRLKFDNVWNSGRYYRLWELERAGVNVLSKNNQHLVAEVFRQNKNSDKAIRMYKAYKRAFHLEA